MLAFLNFDRIIGLVLGFLLAWAVLAGINQFLWLPAAREEGREQYIAEQAAADRKAEIERKGDDAKLRGMSDYDLCVDGLRSRGMQDACEQLRGLPEG